MESAFRSLYMIFCLHAVGDYFFQSDFIAKTKGSNFWHMIVHSLLYTVPFLLRFGLDNRILFLYLTHITIDSLKAHYNKINYVTDQLLHIVVLIILYSWETV